MSAPGLLVVLDGPLAVGRRTTAAALQQAWPEIRSGPLLAAGLASMLAALGPAQRRWEGLVLSSTDAMAADQWGPLGRELVAGMHRAATAWAHQGADVVLDTVLLDRAAAADLDAACAGLTVVTVGMRCDLDVLESRAEELGYSPAAARAQARAARGIVDHDLVVDTTGQTTSEVVADILEVVARRVRG